MARRREVTREEADVLANLGHKIHYYYDPAEPVGRHSKRSNGTIPTNGRKQHKSSKYIWLTSRRPSTSLRKTRKAAASVYDAVVQVLKAQHGDPLNRTKMVRVVARVIGKTEKAVQIQISRLIKLGNLKAEMPRPVK